MSWDINRVILVGRLTKDCDLKYTGNGTAVLSFSIAVGLKTKPDGSKNTSFFNVVVWSKLAELCSTYLHKGSQIAIDGRLEQRSWTAQDGSRRSVVEVIAERIEFIGGNPVNKEKEPAPAQPADGFYDNTNFDPTPVDPSFDQDIPF